MSTCYFAPTLAVRTRTPQRLLSLAVCGWLTLFVLVVTPQGVSADCCPYNGASFYQDSVSIYESAGIVGQPPGILPVINQVNDKTMGVSYPEDRVINVVANEQTVSSDGLKGILLDFNTSCDPIPAAAFYAANNLDNYTLPYIQPSPIIALIQRGFCNFTKKLDAASSTAVTANFTLIGVIFYDNEPDSLLGKSPDISWNISTYPDNDVDVIIAIDGNPNNIDFVPAIFVRNGLGLKLLQQMDYFEFNASMYLNTIYGNTWIRSFVRVNIFNSSTAADATQFWLSFLKNWVPGMLMAALTVTLASIIFRLHRSYAIRNRNAARARAHAKREIDTLPRSILDTFSVRLYDAEEVKNQSCAICLDDFVEGESSVRLLPCSHGFCVECIDPWLSSKSAQCPICKFNCLPSKPSTDLSEADLTEDGAVAIEMTYLPVVPEARDPPQTREIWEQVERLNPEVSEQERRTTMERGERMDKNGEEMQVVDLEVVVIGTETVEERKAEAAEEGKAEAVEEKKEEVIEEEKKEAAEEAKAEAAEEEKAEAVEEKKEEAVEEEKKEAAEDEKAEAAEEEKVETGTGE